MIPPHGGQLVNCLAEAGRKAETLARAKELALIIIDSDLVSDLETLRPGSIRL